MFYNLLNKINICNLDLKKQGKIGKALLPINFSISRKK